MKYGGLSGIILSDEHGHVVQFKFEKLYTPEIFDSYPTQPHLIFFSPNPVIAVGSRINLITCQPLPAVT